MSDPIAEIEVRKYQDKIGDDLAKQIRQQIGRELLEDPLFKEIPYSIVNRVCKLGDE